MNDTDDDDDAADDTDDDEDAHDDTDDDEDDHDDTDDADDDDAGDDCDDDADNADDDYDDDDDDDDDYYDYYDVILKTDACCRSEFLNFANFAFLRKIVFFVVFFAFFVKNDVLEKTCIFFNPNFGFWRFLHFLTKNAVFGSQFSAV